MRFKLGDVVYGTSEYSGSSLFAFEDFYIGICINKKHQTFFCLYSDYYDYDTDKETSSSHQTKETIECIQRILSSNDKTIRKDMCRYLISHHIEYCDSIDDEYDTVKKMKPTKISLEKAIAKMEKMNRKEGNNKTTMVLKEELLMMFKHSAGFESYPSTSPF